jgi:hypothetical protein
MFRHRLRSFQVLLAALCIGVGLSVVQAQSSRTLNTVERRIDTLNRQAKDFERDNMARDEKNKKDPEAAKRSRQLRMEIEEDLKALQSVYNDTVTMLQSSRDLKPGTAIETGRSVRKFASRLRSNLVLPAAEEGDARPDPPPLPDTDRKALAAVCGVIYAFITNPIFDAAAGLDVKNGMRARRELDEMIRLAEHLSNAQETGGRE